MAKGSGGTRSGGAGGVGFDNATQSLYNAVGTGNKSAIAKASAKVAKLISKMPTDKVKAAAKSVSEAAFFSQKSGLPKGEYNATTYKYNAQLAKLYNTEAKNRK